MGEKKSKEIEESSRMEFELNLQRDELDLNTDPRYDIRTQEPAPYPKTPHPDTRYYNGDRTCRHRPPQEGRDQPRSASAPPSSLAALHRTPSLTSLPPSSLGQSLSDASLIDLNHGCSV